MSELKVISANEFTALTARFSQQASFAQSAEMGELRAKLGWQVEYVAFERAGGPVACAMAALSASRAPEYDLFCGPLMDYNDAALVAAFTAALRKRAHALGAVTLHCSPHVVLHLRDRYGANRQDDTAQLSPGTSALKNLCAAGWQWAGETVATPQPRFHFVRELAPTYDETFKGFDASARSDIRRARENGLTVRRVERAELPTLVRILEGSAERQNFKIRSLAYYEALLDAFGKEAWFMVVEYSSVELKARLEEKRARLEAKCKQVSSQGKRRQYADEIEACVRALDRAATYPETNGCVPVNAGIFLLHGAETVYLFGGTLSNYLGLNAVSLLQEYMMQRSLETGIHRYNFYGVSGIFDRNDPTYGVLAFKQAYGGVIEEYLGDFDIVLRPLKHRLKKLLSS